MIVLLAGTSGTGKSTLAALLAARLGITTLLSTDSIRHMLRSFHSREEAPLLYASTYQVGWGGTCQLLAVQYQNLQLAQPCRDSPCSTQPPAKMLFSLLRSLLGLCCMALYDHRMDWPCAGFLLMSCALVLTDCTRYLSCGEAAHLRAPWCQSASCLLLMHPLSLSSSLTGRVGL